MKDPNPCVQALIDANGALKFDNELVNWQLVEKLMSDKYSREVALGIHDDARMAADYALVVEYIGMDKPFDVKTHLHQRVPRPFGQDDQVAQPSSGPAASTIVAGSPGAASVPCTMRVNGRWKTKPCCCSQVSAAA